MFIENLCDKGQVQCYLLFWTYAVFTYRSIRYVEKTSTDKIIDDKIIEETLMRLCDRFYMAYQPASRPTEQFEHNTNLDIMLATLGFTTEKIESDIPNLGSGVGVIKGKVPKGAVVSLYPGKQTYK